MTMWTQRAWSISADKPPPDPAGSREKGKKMEFALMLIEILGVLLSAIIVAMCYIGMIATAFNFYFEDGDIWGVVFGIVLILFGLTIIAGGVLSVISMLPGN